MAVPYDVNKVTEDKAKHPNDVLVNVNDAGSFEKGRIQLGCSGDFVRRLNNGPYGACFLF